MLISPEDHRIHCAIRFGFRALNNETKYKVLLTGLCLAKEMQVDTIDIYSES